MKLTKGSPKDVDISVRHYQFSRSSAINDIYDALVELITNSDDSYHRLYTKKIRGDDGGPILVEIIQRRKEEPSLLIVYDRAEGMTIKTMEEKFCSIGERWSKKGDRGFMGRGGKDCTALGKMTIESIKDNKYYKCELTTKPQFISYHGRVSASKKIRQDLNIGHGDGTVVKLEIEPQHKIPRLDTIIRDLPWHYSLRDILSENSPTKLLIRNPNKKTKPEKIIHTQPEGELVCDENFLAPGYPGAKAILKIWRSHEPFEDHNDSRFRHSGLLIKGQRAIHECSLLHSGLEKDPHAKRYFGKIECDYIDQLLYDYDENLKKNNPHPPENPTLLIDPNRQIGLSRKHPFTEALLKIPSERLQKLIEQDKEKERSTQKEIANKETQERLNKLAQAANKFLNQQVEELEELTPDDAVDEESFVKKGVLIYPTYVKVAKGEIRSLTFYVNKSICSQEGHTVEVLSDDPSISILDSPFQLRQHKKRNEFLIGNFRVQGDHIKDAVCIETKSNGIPNAEALINVVEDKIEEHEFMQPLEFEYNNYRVKEGSIKTLRLYAKYPELVSKDNTEIVIVSSDSESVPVRGRCYLTPIIGSNYAIGEVKIQGRRLKSKNFEITASLNGDKAVAKVKVIQKEEKGVNLEIKIVPEDLGVYRAMWAVPEGKPNLLKISAKHDSIKRYLGDAPDFAGQEKPHFRVLLAEIVAESVCRKSLGLEVEDKPWEFKDAFLGTPSIVVDAVYSHLQKRIRDFVAIAHSVMLSNTEIT